MGEDFSSPATAIIRERCPSGDGRNVVERTASGMGKSTP